MRTQWVFRLRCGCPVGVVEGSHAPTEYDAWNLIYDRAKDIRDAQLRGVTAEHMDHERYSREVFPQMMSGQCPHREAS